MKNIGKKILILISILLICIIIGWKNYNQDKIFNKVEVKEELKVEMPVVTKATMIMAGDNLIHSSIYKDAKTSNGYDFRYIYMN